MTDDFEAWLQSVELPTLVEAFRAGQSTERARQQGRCGNCHHERVEHDADMDACTHSDCLCTGFQNVRR